MIQIIPYQSEYQPHFKALNLEWLEKYNLTEEADLKVLNDPDGTILAGGGVIFLAKSGAGILGTAALIHEHDAIYELAKMAVRPDMRGHGISKLLLEACLAAARQLRASQLILFSNSQLKTALGLYEKYGFRCVKVKNSPFETADIKMELAL
ncbi:MAG: GNAT family N-acetyltransferase [Chitinophagaceae bacterium]